ncbi:epsin-2-like isoform X26 [Penaeus japonicus]|uniref:epsin-2-like isoform X26 n=1 Tax=Penaeus japonicus TaxID=27405 RepID=UPI001C717304|nr:epsin-2-like isoform X26 [Penaeus japonicus]
MALQMNISGLRRNMKNIAHNYTDAQIKVREATSNDPWGPSSTLMSEVADLTYNVVAFSEIMQMIWKRLNDHGRNWRHVYKALVLLEYLIKTGSEKVADQCKENIFAIQTLKDFQYIEENKDQGMSVREKAKALVTLLKDDERLRNERVRALKAKERFAQSVSGIGSDSDISSPTSPSYPDTYVTSTSRPNERNAYGVQDGPSGLEPQLEAARPQTVGEEELQLQLALAMSKEEAEQEEQRRRSDDVRLQMALTQSEEEFNGGNAGMARSTATPPVPSSLDPWGMPTSGASISPQHTSQPKTDPWGMALPNGGSETPKQNTDPWGSPASGPPSRVTSPPTTSDPWGQPPARSPEPPMGGICGNDPWAVLSSSSPAPSNSADASDPWEPVSVKAPSRDPFAPISPTNNGDVDEFSALSTRDKPANNCIGIEDGLSDAFDLSGLSSTVPDNNREKKSKSPAAFLGENSNLVNLDNLVGGTKQATPALGVSPLNSTSITSNSPLTINNNNNNLNNNNNNNSITNPFVTPGLAPSSFAGVNPFSAPSPPNPFQAQQAPKPSMNQLRTTGIGGPPLAAAPPSNAGAPGPAPGPWGSPQPSVGFGMAPSAAASQDENPFLL